MAVSTIRILFAINETTGLMKSFGSFASFEDLTDKLNGILSGEDADQWPDGWTPYAYEHCSARFSHFLWWTPKPDGHPDDDWLPVAFDPFVSFPLPALFQTARGDDITEKGETRDAWIIEPRAPTLAEFLQAKWETPSETDFQSFAISAQTLVAEVGDLLMFADLLEGRIEFQVHGTDPNGFPVFWRANMTDWVDYT